MVQRQLPHTATQPRNTKCSPLYEWLLAAVKSGCPAQLTANKLLLKAHGYDILQLCTTPSRVNTITQKNEVFIVYIYMHFPLEFLSGSCGNCLYACEESYPARYPARQLYRCSLASGHGLQMQSLQAVQLRGEKGVWTHGGVNSGISGISVISF